MDPTTAANSNNNIFLQCDIKKNGVLKKNLTIFNSVPGIMLKFYSHDQRTVKVVYQAEPLYFGSV